MASGYDKDGCYCLLVAIIGGIGASKARRIYEGEEKSLNTKKQFDVLEQILGRNDLRRMKEQEE